MPPPGSGIGMSPQDFIQAIANAVAQKIAAQPPKTFEVKRLSPDGQPRIEQVTLPQAITELTDHFRVANELKRIEIQTSQELILALEKNRKLGVRALKANRGRKAANEDDDDEEDES